MLYVDYCSEEDQVLELARFLGKLRGKSGAAEAATQLIQQCETLVKDNKYLEVLTKILEESKELFASGADKDVEAFLCLFSSLVVKLGKDKLVHIKDPLFSAIAGGQDKPIVRLSVLNNLYNSNESTEWRVLVLTQILKFAQDNKQGDVVAPLLDGLEERFKDLNATNAQKREVLQAAIPLVKESNITLALTLQTKLYQTLAGASDAEVLPHVESAKQYFLDAITQAKVYQYDEIVASPVLAKTDQKLAELVKIFASGDYADFVAFQDTNPTFFQTHGIDAEAAAHKVRVLTVLSVVSRAGGASGNIVTIPFSALASALKVPEDEVENWIIAAITEELLDARVDELASAVHVTYALQRSFGKEQWEQLSEKLSIWKDNLRGMLKVIENSREQAYVELAQLQQQ